MAIIENKLRILITVIVFMFAVYSIQFVFDYSKNTTIFNYDSINTTGLNQSELENLNEQGINTGFSIIESIGGFALLQVEGAPEFINFFFGFIAILLWTILTLLVVAWVREIIGLT